MLENVDKGPDDSNQNFLPNLVRLASLSSVTTDKEQFWEDFRRYLINQGQRKHSVRNRVRIGKKFCHILETKLAQELIKLTHGSRVHTMKALLSEIRQTGLKSIIGLTRIVFIIFQFGFPIYFGHVH